MTCARPNDLAIVIGATGGMGAAFVRAIARREGGASPVEFSRDSAPALDLLDESSIATCAAHAQTLGTPRLIVDATGLLHRDAVQPEKSWRQLDAAAMAELYAVNAIGPALLMKHFLPLLPRSGRAVFATLSAKVGSIGDNQIGGWYSYRAAKAALNQLVHTAAIELKRTHPHAICVALHPGTVDTPLSSPFRKTGLDVQPPLVAAERLLAVVAGLGPTASGGFFDHRGEPLPW